MSREEFKQRLAKLKEKRIPIDIERPENHCFYKGVNRGLQESVEEIRGWKSLLIKAHETTPYANPKEAKREHDNTVRLLDVMISKIEGKFYYHDTLLKPADGEEAE